MIKKLDKLILQAFIGPFFATFFISEFVLIMQFFWLYLDDLVGKGLEIGTIATLIMYVAANCIPLALPLALLLSSIMTFGNLGESFELVAIKSAGIPLTRFMRPLLIVAILFTSVDFVFNNNINPVINLKLNTLKYDIIVAKPAFDIKEGVFYDKMSGFIIKLGRKEPDNKTIHDIIIFEKNNGLQDNIIVAKDGVMNVTPDKRSLQFDLKDGCSYQETSLPADTNTRYTRIGFKEYIKSIDLSDFHKGPSNEDNFKSDPKMLSLRQLKPVLDSLEKRNTSWGDRSKRDFMYTSLVYRYQDSTWAMAATIKGKIKSLDQTLPDSIRKVANDLAVNKIGSLKSNADIINNDYKAAQDIIAKHQIEVYRKFTLSFSCFVMFLIGAPLGSIIRKGGLGTPLIFAVIFFSLFYVFNTIGEKMSSQRVVPAAFGMWLSTFILLPVGIFLTVKAMKDSTLFNKEFWFRIGKFFVVIKQKIPFLNKKRIEE